MRSRKIICLFAVALSLSTVLAACSDPLTENDLPAPGEPVDVEPDVPSDVPSDDSPDEEHGVLCVTPEVRWDESSEEQARSMRFGFRVEVDDESVSGQVTDMTFEGGVAEFELTYGESARAKLPAGTGYTVHAWAVDDLGCDVAVTFDPGDASLTDGSVDCSGVINPYTQSAAIFRFTLSARGE